MLRTLVLAFALMLPFTATAAEPMPRLSGNVFIHDPSVIATDGGWASFATGVEGAPDGGMPRTKSSPDGIKWTETGAIPGGQPGWITEELGKTPPNLWAPTIHMREGVAYLYYSGSTFGKNDSVIGLMTNPAFDARRPAEGWTDQGMVLRAHQGGDFNAIDPFRIDTADGKAWLTFGSFWDGIRMVALDPVTGMRADDEMLKLASRGGGAIEAPAILEHDGKFYLFVSFDSCCRGVASTYRIMVGRADAVTGPYVDRDGKPLLEGGGTELLSKTGRYYGPGGQETFTAPDGSPWLAFHYYDGNNGGAPKLQLAPLGWSADGWPELGTLPD